MGKRLYVGNLPYDADEAALREAFAQDGWVVERVHIVLDRETQRPRGFAFLEMATEEQAKQAIGKMDGTMFGTRQLRVTEAEERRPGGPGGPGGSRGPGGGPGGPARSERPAGQGGYGGGGQTRERDGGDVRVNRFGPDAKPKRERGLESRRGTPRRRPEDDEDGSFGGRRGHGKYDDDDDDE